MARSFLQLIAVLLAAAGAMAGPLRNKHKEHRGLKAHQASETLLSNGTIPATKFDCTGYQLDECAVEEAKEKAIVWGETYVVARRGMSYWEDEQRTAGIWMCNCKLSHGDHVVREELEEYLEILAQQCGGDYRSGWVWSDKWNKSFNLGPAWERKKGKDVLEPIPMACPLGCLEAGNEFGLG
ncbi:hypothetical protein SLS62_000375 [Diatrype stigma]|uniref:Uncharacterized protein n=1 Tax=Diatrype stigma TaxID=117547 RepID=A0AAN9UZQ7_9PEZI